MVDRYCKMFRDDETMNPSNYDIYLDINDIPVNIPKENTSELQNRLQKLMPLGTLIHLNVIGSVPESFVKENVFTVSNHLRFNKRRVVIK